MQKSPCFSQKVHIFQDRAFLEVDWPAGVEFIVIKACGEQMSVAKELLKADDI